MKRRSVIKLCIAGTLLVLLTTPFAMTRLQEYRLFDRTRLQSEVGYAIPSNSRISATDARIWSLADGVNYSWTIVSEDTLLPWVESVAVHEYQNTYRAVVDMPDGHTETSYISLSQDNLRAEVETFRP